MIRSLNSDNGNNSDMFFLINSTSTKSFPRNWGLWRSAWLYITGSHRQWFLFPCFVSVSPLLLFSWGQSILGHPRQSIQFLGYPGSSIFSLRQSRQFQFSVTGWARTLILGQDFWFLSHLTYFLFLLSGRTPLTPRAMVLNWEILISSPSALWGFCQCLEIPLVVTTGEGWENAPGLYWIEVRPWQQRIIWPKMSILLRFRNPTPGIKVLFWKSSHQWH